MAWFLVESQAGYTFTTVGRIANVELTVPAEVDRAEATAPLVDLAPPSRSQCPSDPRPSAQRRPDGRRERRADAAGRPAAG